MSLEQPAFVNNYEKNEVIDVSPEVLKDEVPIFFFPARSTDLGAYEPTFKELTEEGRRVISLNHPRCENSDILTIDIIAHSEGGINAIKAAILHPEKIRNLVLFDPGKMASEFSSAQIHEMLRSLHTQGVGIIIMATIDDPIFKIEDIQKIIKTDMIDCFLSLPGNYSAINNFPQTIISAAQQMIEAVEQKKHKI